MRVDIQRFVWWSSNWKSGFRSSLRSAAYGPKIDVAHAPERQTRSSDQRSPTGIVGASKVECYSNGFALLTAAPEIGWSCGCFQDWSPPEPFLYPRSVSVEPIHHPRLFYDGSQANAVSGVTH